jgi:outer membrane protein assembly factor BamB
VINGVVYFQDMNSNLYALDRSTGKEPLASRRGRRRASRDH